MFEYTYDDFFAERLMKLRVRKGVSAREMSLAIGQNSSYINRIENRQTLPSMNGFFYICEYLEITPMDFFNDQIENPMKLNALIEELKNLDDLQLDTIMYVAKGLQHKKYEKN